MNTLTKTSITSKLSEIKSLISGAIEGLLKAAAIVVEILDVEAMEVEEIADKTGVPITFVRGLEKVGRNKLRPELFFADKPGQRALARLPYEEQGKYLNQPVKLLVIGSNGKPEELLTNVDVLTPEQVSQVFATNRIRDLSEQRAWVEGNKLKKLAEPIGADEPWRKVGKTIVFMKPCKMTAKQLINLLSELEG